jgi:hypothetical protein
MVLSINLPTEDGRRHKYTMHSASPYPATNAPAVSRAAYAAAHVVADPLTAAAGGGTGAIDWAATMRVRHRLWDLGLGVAEAMDTAQRGMGLGWVDAQRLIEQTLSAAQQRDAAVLVGVSTDQLDSLESSLDAVLTAYLEQLEFVEERGGVGVVMASRQLAHAARTPQDYLAVYDAILESARRPVVLHWLGVAFDPQLAGYWGSAEYDLAAQTVLELIGKNVSKVDGIKVSLLNADREVELRNRLPQEVKLYTGDDFNYVDLIAGADGRYSHALLGAFAAIGPIAVAALKRLDVGDETGFRELLTPTLALSRLVFAAPTQYYKVGIAWLSYLQGDQAHFRMLGGLESARSLQHLLEVFRLADQIHLFHDPELALDRVQRLLILHGLG